MIRATDAQKLVNEVLRSPEYKEYCDKIESMIKAEAKSGGTFI